MDTPNILSLPKNVLSKIYGYLCLKDMVALAESNDYLDEAFDCYVRGKYRRTAMHNFVGPMGPETVSGLFGPRGSRMDKVSHPYQFICIERHCPYLKNLYMQVDDNNFAAAKKMMVRLKSLKYLKLVIRTMFSGNILLCLKDLPCLEKLRISTNFTCHTSALSELVNLRCIEIIGASKNEAPGKEHDIFDTLSPLSKIESITIKNSLMWTPFRDRSATFPHLKVLKCYNCAIVSKLPSCPKIQELVLIGNEMLANNFLTSMQHLSRTLEKLSLHVPPNQSVLVASVIRVCKGINNFCWVKPVVTSSHIKSLLGALKDNGFAYDNQFNLEIHREANSNAFEQARPKMNEFPYAELCNLQVKAASEDQSYLDFESD